MHMYDSLVFVSHVVYFLSEESYKRWEGTDMPFLFCIFKVKNTDFSFICQYLMWTAKYLWYKVKNSVYCVMFTVQ